MRGALAVAIGVAVAACRTPAVEPPVLANPGEGIAIAIYAQGTTSFAIVDDRRTIEIRGGTFDLDRVPGDVPLPSLVIEPIGSRTLHVTACTRERIDTTPQALDELARAQLLPARAPAPRAAIDDTTEPRLGPVRTGLLSPLVHCTATGASGRQLVRVLYTAPAIGYRAHHDVTLAAGRATIDTRFAIATPAWRSRATLVLYEGLPGSRDVPRELVRGTVALDGSTAVLSLPARAVAARVRRVYDGAVREPASSTMDLDWGKESRSQVWLWLELDAALSAGPVHAILTGAGLDRGETTITAEQREPVTVRGATRLPLWIDDAVHGVRTRLSRQVSGSPPLVIDRVQLSISNSADTPREVWLEEHLRDRQHKIVQATPAPPTITGTIARIAVTVPPHGHETATFTVQYAQ
ncbi:MAG TPA: hypothetical protein VFQ53_42310 [Kofleriaceae bacterium]|nr:hypothetical protein [Kofleriaceae bacterium]